MSRHGGRRRFIRQLIGAAGWLGAGTRARAQTAGSIAVTPLADGVFLVTGAGCNVLAVEGPDGVTLVDGGLAENSAALLATVSAATRRARVHTLINTHWHSDHTGSNEAIGRAGGLIVAHDNTRRWLNTRVYRELQDRTYPRRPKEALPTRTTTTKGVLAMGPTRIEYGALPPAHTNGDLYVFLPDPDIMMVSDVLTPGRYPVADYSTGGWINGLIEAAAAIERLANDSTRLLPGIGPAQTVADLRTQREMLITVRDRVWTLIRQGKSLEEVAAEAPTREFDAERGANQAFLKSTYIGLVRHSRQLGGVL